MRWAAGYLAAGPSPPPDAAAIRAKAREVLERPEFQGRSEGGGLGWLLDKLADLLGWLGGLREAASPLFWVLLAGCVLLLVVLVGHITWTVWRVFRAGDAATAGARAAAERGRRSLAYREEALRRAAAGEFTDAIRYLFLSLVYRFDESGNVSFEKSYTNREYLDQFADRGSLYDSLRVFVDTLDDTWYGQRPADQRQYERCLGVYQALG